MSFTPATFDSPQAPASIQKKRRIWPWVVIPFGCMTIVLICCCGGFAMLGFGVLAAIKSSEPYQTALQRVQASEEVKEAIGEPIQPDFVVQGKVDVQNDNGSADVTFPVRGPKGSAQVHVSGVRVGGAWSYDDISVTLGDGTVIDLSEEAKGQVTTIGIEPPT